jgi:hypothetical protein
MGDYIKFSAYFSSIRMCVELVHWLYYKALRLWKKQKDKTQVPYFEICNKIIDICPQKCGLKFQVL